MDLCIISGCKMQHQILPMIVAHKVIKIILIIPHAVIIELIV